MVQQCDGTELNFYNDDFCGPHPITVLIFAAGWCGPCVDQTDSLRETFVIPYESRGVRVIEVLLDDGGGPTTLASCSGWLEAHNLDGVSVTVGTASRTLFSNLSESGTLPAAFVINEAGRIAFSEDGRRPDDVDLRTAVEAELTRLGR